MESKSLASTLFLFFLLFGSSAASLTLKSKPHHPLPCKRLVFYLHDIVYNGKNSKNATSAIVGAPAWGNKTILAKDNHFGDVVVFDDPITSDNNLRSTRLVARKAFTCTTGKLHSLLGSGYPSCSTQPNTKEASTVLG